MRSAGSANCSRDPRVVTPSDHPLVQVGFAGVHAHDPDPLHLHGPVASTDQLFEMEVPDVARVVVAGDRVQRRLDPLGVGEPGLVLLPIPVGREVPAADHRIGLQLVDLLDHPMEQVRHEVGGTDVRIGDVGDRDHVGSVGGEDIQSTRSHGAPEWRGTISLRDRPGRGPPRAARVVGLGRLSTRSHAPGGRARRAGRRVRQSARCSRRTRPTSSGPTRRRRGWRSGRSCSSGAVGDAVGSVLGLKLRKRDPRRRASRSPTRVGGSALSVGALVLAIWFLGLNLAAGPFPSVARSLQRSGVVRAVDSVLPPPPVTRRAARERARPHRVPGRLLGPASAARGPGAAATSRVSPPGRRERRARRWC